jgi:hypothetical protein
MSRQVNVSGGRAREADKRLLLPVRLRSLVRGGDAITFHDPLAAALIFDGHLRVRAGMVTVDLLDDGIGICAGENATSRHGSPSAIAGLRYYSSVFS